jgi:hypothetical protein
MRALLQWLTSHMSNPRVIYDRNGRSPYLSRWYILGAPKMPDGSPVFDRIGAPREGAVWPIKGVGVYIHRFHQGDDEPELHNHPWRWAVSLILAGGYIEERRDPDDRVRTRKIRPWTINFIRSGDFHRVDLLGEDAWSLFVAGPKFQGWGFWNRHSGRFWPWREFITPLRDPTSFAKAK